MTEREQIMREAAEQALEYLNMDPPRLTLARNTLKVVLRPEQTWPRNHKRTIVRRS